MDDASFVRLAMSEDRARDDAALLVRFEWMDVPDEEETKKNGYPCSRRREFIRIRIPGSQEERFRKVTDEHRRRFPRAYAAFKAGHADVVDGTALKECPILNANEVSLLNHHGVASVEQGAALSDSQISGMGHGVRAIRDRLKAWHEARQSQKPVAELQARLQEKDEQMAALMERLAALEKQGVPMLSPEAPTPAVAVKPKRTRKKAATVAEG